MKDAQDLIINYDLNSFGHLSNFNKIYQMTPISKQEDLSAYMQFWGDACLPGALNGDLRKKYNDLVMRVFRSYEGLHKTTTTGTNRALLKEFGVTINLVEQPIEFTSKKEAPNYLSKFLNMSDVNKKRLAQSVILVNKALLDEKAMSKLTKTYKNFMLVSLPKLEQEFIYELHKCWEYTGDATLVCNLISIEQQLFKDLYNGENYLLFPLIKVASTNSKRTVSSPMFYNWYDRNFSEDGLKMIPNNVHIPFAFLRPITPNIMLVLNKDISIEKVILNAQDMTDSLTDIKNSTLSLSLVHKYLQMTMKYLIGPDTNTLEDEDPINLNYEDSELDSITSLEEAQHKLYDLVVSENNRAKVSYMPYGDITEPDGGKNLLGDLKFLRDEFKLRADILSTNIDILTLGYLSYFKLDIYPVAFVPPEVAYAHTAVTVLLKQVKGTYAKQQSMTFHKMINKYKERLVAGVPSSQEESNE